MRDLVPFIQFQKHEKQPWRSVTFNKVAGTHSSIAICKWYQIACKNTRFTFSFQIFLNFCNIWVKVFKNGSSKTCRREAWSEENREVWKVVSNSSRSILEYFFLHVFLSLIFFQQFRRLVIISTTITCYEIKLKVTNYCGRCVQSYL